MANYYTRTVITEPVLLTSDLSDLLTARGAELYPEGQHETVLDGIVHERPPLTSYSVVFEDGWNNQYEDFEEWEYDHGEDGDTHSDEFKRLFELGEHEILREIIKVNPDKAEIVMQSSWSCSKMRLDGFGGSGLIVNRKGYLYLTTSHYVVEADGTIKPGAEFVTWDEHDKAAAEHDEEVAVDAS